MNEPLHFTELLHEVSSLHYAGSHKASLERLESRPAPSQAMYWVWKGTLLCWLDRRDEAEAAYRAGLSRPELRISDPRIARSYATLLLDAQRFEEVLEITGKDAAAHDILCLCLNSRALIQMHRSAEALQRMPALAKAQGNDPEPWLVWHAALRATDDSRGETAMRVLKRLVNMKASGVTFDSRQDTELTSLIEEFGQS